MLCNKLPILEASSPKSKLKLKLVVHSIMFMDYLMISKIKLTLNKENMLPCLLETKLPVLLNKNSEPVKLLKVTPLSVPLQSTKLLVHTL
jgi:hypothetical protein